MGLVYAFLLLFSTHTSICLNYKKARVGVLLLDYRLRSITPRLWQPSASATGNYRFPTPSPCNSPSITKRPEWELHPRIAVLQTAALLLGYRAPIRDFETFSL